MGSLQRLIGYSLRSTLAIILACTLATPGFAKGWHFSGLKPGEFVTHRQHVPIRIVFIGFEEGAFSEEDLRSWLPETYRPAVRFPQFYGLNGRDMGLEYEFRYRLVYKSKAFANRFFRHLARIGHEGDLTAYQQAYNDQENNVLDVTGPVLYIHAPAVERWLDEADGGHDRRGYTIYFVNWHGRADFRFHVYTKEDEPDPDTHFNFGGLDELAVTSWGGTSSRSWFYDFSAGPAWNTVNWLVDFEDLNGNGIPEYRMPNIWEYTEGGYRSPDALGGDMGLLTRFVAVNLLFTSSPLYDPLVTAPGPRGKKVTDISMFEDDPENKGAGFLDPAFTRSKLRALQPYYRWQVAFRAFDPIDDASKLTLDIFAGNSDDPGCWVPFGTPFAQMFCHYDQNLDDYVPAYGEHDYVGEVFAFNTTEEGLGDFVGLLGFADDNWEDGTQSYSFVFGADFYRDFGYGFTSTTVHEVGHHIGLSHPHDGYDAEYGIDYGPVEDFFFVWAGDESDTVMHYLSLSNGFGRHNTDNMHRWETAGYLNWANALAGDLLEHAHAHRVWSALWRADHAADEALHALRDWDYAHAVSKAREAYVLLAAAAESIGMTSASLAAARRALPGAAPTKEVCRPRLMLELMQRAR